MRHVSKRINKSGQYQRRTRRIRSQSGGGFIQPLNLEQFKKLNVVEDSKPQQLNSTNGQPRTINLQALPANAVLQESKNNTVPKKIVAFENILMEYPIVEPPHVNIVSEKKPTNIKEGPLNKIKDMGRSMGFAPQANFVLYRGNYGFYGYGITCYNILLDNDTTKPSAEYCKTEKKQAVPNPNTMPINIRPQGAFNILGQTELNDYPDYFMQHFLNQYINFDNTGQTLQQTLQQPSHIRLIKQPANIFQITNDTDDYITTGANSDITQKFRDEITKLNAEIHKLTEKYSTAYKSQINAKQNIKKLQATESHQYLSDFERVEGEYYKLFDMRTADIIDAKILEIDNTFNKIYSYVEQLNKIITIFANFIEYASDIKKKGKHSFGATLMSAVHKAGKIVQNTEINFEAFSKSVGSDLKYLSTMFRSIGTYLNKYNTINTEEMYLMLGAITADQDTDGSIKLLVEHLNKIIFTYGLSKDPNETEPSKIYLNASKDPKKLTLFLPPEPESKTDNIRINILGNLTAVRNSLSTLLKPEIKEALIDPLKKQQKSYFKDVIELKKKVDIAHEQYIKAQEQIKDISSKIDNRQINIVAAQLTMDQIIEQIKLRYTEIKNIKSKYYDNIERNIDTIKMKHISNGNVKNVLFHGIIKILSGKALFTNATNIDNDIFKKLQFGDHIFAYCQYRNDGKFYMFYAIPVSIPSQVTKFEQIYNQCQTSYRLNDDEFKNYYRNYMRLYTVPKDEVVTVYGNQFILTSQLIDVLQVDILKFKLELTKELFPPYNYEICQYPVIGKKKYRSSAFPKCQFHIVHSFPLGYETDSTLVNNITSRLEPLFARVREITYSDPTANHANASDKLKSYAKNRDKHFERLILAHAQMTDECNKTFGEEFSLTGCDLLQIDTSRVVKDMDKLTNMYYYLGNSKLILRADNNTHKKMFIKSTDLFNGLTPTQSGDAKPLISKLELIEIAKYSTDAVTTTIPATPVTQPSQLTSVDTVTYKGNNTSNSTRSNSAGSNSSGNNSVGASGTSQGPYPPASNNSQAGGIRYSSRKYNTTNRKKGKKSKKVKRF
jgi:hypothetical protein